MSWVLDVKRGRPPIVPPPPETPDVIFGAKLQFWFRAGDWTLSGTDITAMDNLEGTVARDITTVFGTPPPQAVTEDGVDAILFQGGSTGGYFQWDGQMGAVTEADVFFIHKTASDPQAALDDTGLHHIYDSIGSNRSHYNLHTTGHIFESFGLNSTESQIDTGNPAWDLTLQHLYNVQARAASYDVWRNGNNSHYSDAIARSIDFSNAVMKWGRTNGAGGVNWRWAGHGYELICLNDIANTTEKNKLNVYAADRYPALPALASF